MKITITDATEAECRQFWAALLLGEDALKERAVNDEGISSPSRDHATRAALNADILRAAFEQSDASACIGNNGRVKR